MKTLLIYLLTLLLAGLVLYAQKSDPSMGTWKLNVGKSTFSPEPTLQSLTIMMEPAEDGVSIRVEGIDSGGKPVAWQVTAKYDGKDYPVKGSSTIDTYALKRVNASTTESIHKKDGKVVSTNTRVVSNDSKVLTLTATGTNAQGKPFKNVMVFEKQ